MTMGFVISGKNLAFSLLHISRPASPDLYTIVGSENSPRINVRWKSLYTRMDYADPSSNFVNVTLPSSIKLFFAGDRERSSHHTHPPERQCQTFGST